MPYHNKSIQGWNQLRQAGKLDRNPERCGTGSLRWMNSTQWHSAGSKGQWPDAVSSSGGADLRACSWKGSKSVKDRGRECF